MSFRTRTALMVGAAMVALAVGGPAKATTVAIVQGGFYTPNLMNALTGQGVTVSEIASYTALSLSLFDAVIHYGNSFTDTVALETYVGGGGRLVLTPWSGHNFSLPATLAVFDNGGSAIHSELSPGITINDPGNPLLALVALPTTPGAFTEGRLQGINQTAGTTDIADWTDGTAMIGQRSHGAGVVVGINLQVITSDTAYTVINQPWATQLFVNAVGAGTNAIPEPVSMALLGCGLLGLALARRRAA